VIDLTALKIIFIAWTVSNAEEDALFDKKLLDEMC